MFEPYRNGGSRRLPPIHVIGKAQTVDADEPPDIPVEVYGYDADADLSISSGYENTFDVNDAEDAVRLLRKTFHMADPGHHACKKSPEHGGSHFVHCQRAVRLGCDYARLRSALERRARLEFLRECVSRIRSVQSYVQELEALVHAEYRTAYGIRHGCVSEVLVSKLFCLNGLCEDLRVHVNHWNCVKQRLNANKWLHPMLGQLCLNVDYVKRTLLQLTATAIAWLERLILVGLEVLAHCDEEKLTPEVLWNVTRGLEDFNSIVKGVRITEKQDGYYLLHKTHLPQTFGLSPAPVSLDPLFSNYPGRLGEWAKPIPFSRVLSILARERSRYAAQLTNAFFTGNPDFQHILKASHVPPYPWNEDSGQRSMFSTLQDTSDYGTGSLISLSAALLKVGHMRAPDLTDLTSPLVEYSNRELEFAENFLLIVCNSTNLLRKNDGSVKQRSRRKEIHVGDSPVIGRPPKPSVGFGDTPVLSRSDSTSRRKTVSWGDNADTSIRNQVVAKYLDILWVHFGENLDLFLQEPAWQMPKSNLCSKFGSVLLHNDTVIMILRYMMEHACMKDMFQAGAVPPLLNVARRLHVTAAFAAWDFYQCAAESSQASDKCYPCLLPDGDYSTQTGMLLRNAFRPLFSLVTEIFTDISASTGDLSGMFPRPDPEPWLAVEVVAPLVATCRAAYAWCTARSQAFLTAWNVAAFLLIVHADLKILVDETKKAAYQVQSLSSKLHSSASLLQQSAVAILANHHHQISLINTQLQGLSGSSMKTFAEKCNRLAIKIFQQSMPPAKVWKRKTAAEFPGEAHPYVEEVLEALLEPVVMGVAKLRVPAQLGVISLVTRALCEAWTTVILKEKIKFSVPGAQQLGVDFQHMQDWIQGALQNAEVRQSVMDLSVFKYLKGVVLILKKQPQKKGVGRFRDPCSVDDLSCEVEMLSGGSKLEADAEAAAEENAEICSVHNMEEWMALRLHGGTRTWRFPSCFNSSNNQT